MPSDREEWTRGPWIPGWSGNQPRRPEPEGQDAGSGSPPGAGRHRRVPWGPYSTGQQPQNSQQGDSGADWRQQGGQQQSQPQHPHAGRPLGGLGQTSGPQDARGSRSQYDQESGPNRPRGWWWYGFPERAFDSVSGYFDRPDGAREVSHHLYQEAPCIRQGEPAPGRPAEDQQEGEGRNGPLWTGVALAGAGAYGIYKMVQGITPPGWM